MNKVTWIVLAVVLIIVTGCTMYLKKSRVTGLVDNVVTETQEVQGNVQSAFVETVLREAIY